MIKKFLFKAVHRYLESVMPPILIRGVMTPFKQSSPRYLYIDEMIQKYGYTKICVPYEQLGSFDSCYTTQEPNESVYWIYVKDSFVKDEVEHYFLKDSGDVSHPSKNDNTKYLTFESFSTRPFNFLDQSKIKRSLLSHAC
ncbi:MAG: hypothetical protein EOM50_19410 [Erysipelotrichia bacterium]|nr:hypothetical protein [Erysipelotrichia bacterium]